MLSNVKSEYKIESLQKGTLHFLLDNNTLLQKFFRKYRYRKRECSIIMIITIIIIIIIIIIVINITIIIIIVIIIIISVWFLTCFT